MKTVWVITGSGKGAGKTRLALALVRVLPGAAYAKCGTGKRKPGKPGRYFRSLDALERFIERSRKKHIIVESNAYSRRGGDVVIHVDAPVENPRPDATQLMKQADIVVGKKPAPRRWNRVLSFLEGELRRRVLDVLCGHCGGGLSVKSKVWLEKDGRHVFGPGLARLLAATAAERSLRRACLALGLSYRFGWAEIRRAERRLGLRLLERKTGGAGGGGSVPTAHARNLLRLYGQLERRVASYSDRLFARLFKGWTTP